MIHSFVIDHSLTLRQLEEQDASSVFSLLDKNREHVGRWLPWVEKTVSVEDTINFIKKAEEKLVSTGAIECGIYENGVIVGIIGMRYLDKDNKKTELGYWLGEEFEGRGIMTKSVGEVVKYAFSELKLHRVEIRAAIANTKSRAIPERLRFVLEGISREDSFHDGKFESHAVYSLLASEYEKK